MITYSKFAAKLTSGNVVFTNKNQICIIKREVVGNICNSVTDYLSNCQSSFQSSSETNFSGFFRIQITFLVYFAMHIIIVTNFEVNST